ncbi:hypothetical protein OG883_45210 [Streptomyces sp. NBC_01142]|uniref:hypothetical protein n=1 Tax=Streptomyces sp. NBC_01142 TaxID=2975865 RepID=UPI002255C7BE|nr:hypothetical protein [Streptomyces sp. NBC_01142]MCX4826839.1 hypothetical protein [Streptomyces sp. NBC_01142]
MDYWLDVKTAEPADLNSAIKADAEAAHARDAPVSDDGVGLRNEPSDKPRGAVDLLSLLLTVPVGVAVEVAADQIKGYLRRKDGDHRIREATIRWTEETLDADGNVTTDEREQRVELDES